MAEKEEDKKRVEELRLKMAASKASLDLLKQTAKQTRDDLQKSAGKRTMKENAQASTRLTLTAKEALHHLTAFKTALEEAVIKSKPSSS